MINIDSRNLCLLNFADILSCCEKSILDDLYTFGLLEDFSFKKQDTKKVFYYHILHELCNEIIDNKSQNKIVVVYSEVDTKCFKLINCNDYRFKAFITSFINKIRKLLPIKIFLTDITFAEHRDIINNRSGKYIELMNNIQLLLSQCNSKIEFNKIKNFAAKYELTYLSREFFGKVKTKNLFFL